MPLWFKQFYHLSMQISVFISIELHRLKGTLLFEQEILKTEDQTKNIDWHKLLSKGKFWARDFKRAWEGYNEEVWVHIML